MTDFANILNNGVSITSSGTTGIPKTIFRTPENLRACIKIALEGQSISKNSKILTVTRMTHAGGLLLQSLPAYTLGCDIKIQQFNPYSFLKDFENYTHTFLPPAMCEALILTKNFKKLNLAGKYVAMGSDPIPATHIKAFTDQGAIVLANWGMSEIGPWTINKKYLPGDIADDNIVGNTFWCDYKIVDNILYVKGDICYTDGWYETKDKVKFVKDDLFYLGRSNSNAEMH